MTYSHHGHIQITAYLQDVHRENLHVKMKLPSLYINNPLLVCVLEHTDYFGIGFYTVSVLHGYFGCQPGQLARIVRFYQIKTRS